MQLEGQWSEVLLTSLYNITGQQAERQAYEVGSCMAVRGARQACVLARSS